MCLTNHQLLSCFHHPVETVVFNLLDMGCGDYVESVHNTSPAFSLQVLMSLVSRDLVSQGLDDKTKEIVDTLTYLPSFKLFPSFNEYQQLYKCRYFQKHRSLFRQQVVCGSEPLKYLTVTEVKSKVNGFHNGTEWQREVAGASHLLRSCCLLCKDMEGSS